MSDFTPEQARARLRELASEADLSVNQLALIVLGRDPRTVQRWLTGDVPIPQTSLQWIASVAHVRRDPETWAVRITTRPNAPSFYAFHPKSTHPGTRAKYNDESPEL